MSNLSFKNTFDKQNIQQMRNKNKKMNIYKNWRIQFNKNNNNKSDYKIEDMLTKLKIKHIFIY